MIASLGTLLGVAAVITIVGLSDSARFAVASFFNAQMATQVTFTDASGGQNEALTESGVDRLGRLRGVAHAGLIWAVDGSAPFQVKRSPDADPSLDVALPFTAASAGALATMQARVSSGRLYDAGIERRHAIVGLLGAAAASQLGIESTAGEPAIFIGSTPVTIVGIVANVSEQDQVLLGVIVPPSVGDLLASGPQSRQVIVQTALGAAQTIGRQGPYALSPFDPQGVSAQVPPNPATLRQQVEGSLSTLLVALAGVALFIGVVAIANTTLLSVVQRQAEIGLRRAIGFRPRHIASLVLGEAAVIGTIGGTFGATAGVLATGAISVSRGWTPVLDYRLMVAAPLAGTLIGMLAGAYPSWRAARISPAAALSAQ
jgi:putative ABC transport system permease protein